MKGKLFLFFFLAGLFLFNSLCFGESRPVKLAAEKAMLKNLSLLKEAKHSLTLSYKYLLSTQQPDGSWKNSTPITALVLYSFLLRPEYNPDVKTGAAME